MSANPGDPRLGDLIRRGQAGPDVRVAIVGFPSDEGVRRNGGRVGAAGGPGAIRTALARMTPDARPASPFGRLLPQVVDVGDIPVDGNLEADQARLAHAIAPLLRAGVIPIILGGGHETTYGHFLGYVEAGLDVAILNWDAHADVRPIRDGLGHSGSPFRQALEHPSGRCSGYSVAGLMPWRVAREHEEFVRAHGRLWWVDELDAHQIDSIAGDAGGSGLSSFDLDLVDASSAPGVSAPGVGGLAPTLWLRAARECGRNPAFRSFDVVELNPRHDDAAGSTATLAALTVWTLLEGIAARPAD